MKDSDIACNDLTVSFEGTVFEVPSDNAWSFGRQGDLLIDPQNRRVHRHVGKLWYSDGLWMLENCGRATTLVIADQRSPSYARLAPYASMPVPYADALVTFSAGHATYKLHFQQSRVQSCALGKVSEKLLHNDQESTFSASTLRFNKEQLELLTLLAAPRLLGPVSASNLPGNREMAAQLGWSLPKLVRKLDHLCEKFDKAGVPGLTPSSGKPASDRRIVLANLAVEMAVVPANGPGNV